MSKWCEWCKTERNTYTETAILSSDEHGKLGEYTHFFCNTCGYAITSEFRKYTWKVTKAITATHRQVFGEYPFKIEAMQIARGIPGLDVRVVAGLGEVERQE